MITILNTIIDKYFDGTNVIIDTSKVCEIFKKYNLDYMSFEAIIKNLRQNIDFFKRELNTNITLSNLFSYATTAMYLEEAKWGGSKNRNRITKEYKLLLSNSNHLLTNNENILEGMKSSKIHNLLNDNDTLQAIKILLQEFVTAFENQTSEIWNKEVKNYSSDYHRKTLLQQGRCDFDNPTHGLTSDELICLYNYYYFPMHFQSSLDIYSKLFEDNDNFKNRTFFFHDFGCGTLSSTIAFALTCSNYLPIVNDIEEKTNESITLMNYLTNYYDEDNAVKQFSITDKLGFRFQNKDEYVLPPNIK